MQKLPVLLQLDEIRVQLGGVNILEGVRASIPLGSSTALVGPNGAGKTTLLKVLLGQLPAEGHLHWQTRDGKTPRIGYVPQRLHLDRAMPISVEEFLAMDTQILPLWLGVQRRSRDRAMQVLEAVKASHLARRQLGVLSGGEVQRVLLALALQQEPELLVLDEPAAGVDVHGGTVICEILEELQSTRKFTQLLVSHDLAMVTHHANHVIALNRRVIAEGHPRQVLTAKNLTALFGLHMNLVDARAMPDGEAICRAACCQEDSDD